MILSIPSFILRIAPDLSHKLYDPVFRHLFIGYFARYDNLIFSTDSFILLNPFPDLPITSRIAISSALTGSSRFPHRAADESTLNLALATHMSLSSLLYIKSSSLMYAHNFTG